MYINCLGASYGKREEVLEWLQENVGPMLWRKPVVEYHGQGWHMIVQDSRYRVDIDDKEKYLIAILMFS